MAVNRLRVLSGPQRGRETRGQPEASPPAHPHPVVQTPEAGSKGISSAKQLVIKTPQPLASPDQTESGSPR